MITLWKQAQKLVGGQVFMMLVLLFTYFSVHLSLCLYPYRQAELGLNEHHQNEVINYMRFARFKRGLCLKTVDSCFQDLKDSRYRGGQFWARIKQNMLATIAGLNALWGDFSLFTFVCS